MSLDIRAAFDSADADRYDLHSRHLNHQMVRVLKTIGFDARFTPGQTVRPGRARTGRARYGDLRDTGNHRASARKTRRNT